MKVSRIFDALADVIKLTDRVERLEGSVAEMARTFREDSKARDEDFLQHDRRIQKLENLVEFAERFGGRRQLEPPGDGS
ncbi:MAG: hypothetical protein ACR2RL_05140 [Gammaproteobacteria bacterium]